MNHEFPDHDFSSKFDTHSSLLSPAQTARLLGRIGPVLVRLGKPVRRRRAECSEWNARLSRKEVN